MIDRIGVLVLAYGTPASLDEVSAYYTHIRHGHPPTAEQLDNLLTRYRAIGGLSPLNDITRTQAELLEETLNHSGYGASFAIYTGMKHCAPFISDVLKQMYDDGIRKVVGIVLAPHYSSMSVGVYIHEAQDAAREIALKDISFVHDWYLEDPFLNAWVDRLTNTRNRFTQDEQERLKVVFSAHSLPERIIQQGDPYFDELLENSRIIAERGGVTDWQFAWQSAGRTSEAWLGPDILQVLRSLYEDGYRSVLSCPIGFVSDHLEVLYDLDIEAKKVAEELGIHFERAPSLNADEHLIQALKNAVLSNLEHRDEG